jgi:hypothetical protein
MANIYLGGTDLSSSTLKLGSLDVSKAYLGGTEVYSTAAAGPTTTNLVQYLDAGLTTSYPGTGTAWTDIAPGASRSWTLTNSPTYTSGNAGFFGFNGNNQYGAGPAGDTIITFSAPTPKFSWEFIVKTDTTATNSYKCLQSFWKNSGNSDQIWWIGKSGNGIYSTGLHNALRNAATNQSQTLDYASGLFTANTWVYFVINYDFSTGNIEVFKNGATSATYSTTTFLPNLSSNGVNSAEPDIGRQSSNDPNTYWNGDMAVIRVYDQYNLSAAEITQNYDYFKNVRGYSI